MAALHSCQSISSENKEEKLGKIRIPTDPRPGRIIVDGCILPSGYEKFADAIENLKIRDDDVWVCTFPKSGTTWMQEMVWCISNNLDFERAKVSIHERFPYLEASAFPDVCRVMLRNLGIRKDEADVLDSVSQVDTMTNPRFIKSHLPSNLHPRELRDGKTNAKIIYVVRNPKDVCISFYHFCKLINVTSLSFEDFCTQFLQDSARFYASYWDHVLGFWKKRDDPNLLIIKYEDMKKDLPSVIKKTALFLGKDMTDEQISLLSEHLSFSKMKINPAVNWEDRVSTGSDLAAMPQVKRDDSFMRSGTSEQWKTEMTPEMVERFDHWIDQHLIETGLKL